MAPTAGAAATTAVAQARTTAGRPAVRRSRQDATAATAAAAAVSGTLRCGRSSMTAAATSTAVQGEPAWQAVAADDSFGTPFSAHFPAEQCQATAAPHSLPHSGSACSGSPAGPAG